ncbi:MAG TPA: PDZ domain-containing protein [Candidatus Obscuribacter sp.]|nr:PDZ domain-containing protein [Candidatus Obscuribacter sp.]
MHVRVSSEPKARSGLSFSASVSMGFRLALSLTVSLWLAACSERGGVNNDGAQPAEKPPYYTPGNLGLVGLKLAFSGSQSAPGTEPSIYPVVKAVTEGSPCAQAGIQPGEHLLSVNGQDTSLMPLGTIGTRMRGLVEQAVELKLQNQKGEVSERHIIRSRLADSVKGEELQFYVRQALMEQKKKEEALAGGKKKLEPCDLPPLFFHENRSAPLVVEFYESAQGPNPNLEAMIKEEKGKATLVFLRYALADEKLQDLRQEYGIQTPTVLFLPKNCWLLAPEMAVPADAPAAVLSKALKDCLSSKAYEDSSKYY